jgi:uncharacterized protein
MNLTTPFRFICRSLLLLACILILAEQSLAQAINSNAIYRNDTIGVRGVFGNWDIITTQDQAPDALKANFPDDKGPNDSPLFIGIHNSEQLFLRLLVLTYFDDLEAYGKLLGEGITSQGLQIVSARIAEDNTALEMVYAHPQLGLRFIERVALLPDSQVLRMAAWTTANEWDQYAGEISTAFEAIELFDAINAEPGWQNIWADLEQKLSVNNLEGIPLAQATTEFDATEACLDPTSSLLWQVQSPELANNNSQLYLFGSIHVGKENFYPLPAEIENTYRDADFLVFEVDPTSASDPAVMMSLQSRGMLPQGQTLANVISPEVLAEFRRVMGGMGLPAENFMGMQPWFLTLMLSSLQMNALGYLPEYGLESYFLAQKPATMEILELESIQQQIGFLENLNAETFLAYTLKSMGTGSEEIEKLINAWKCADKLPLTEMLFSEFEIQGMTPAEMADLEGLMDILYTQRNMDMSEKIAAYTEAEAGNYFVVIGSAHLLGEGSVVALLREEGFTVTPVSLSP